MSSSPQKTPNRAHRASWENDDGKLDAGSYMEHKEAALRLQRAPKVKGFLDGVVIWFNGLVEGYTTDEVLEQRRAAAAAKPAKCYQQYQHDRQRSVASVAEHRVGLADEQQCLLPGDWPRTG